MQRIIHNAIHIRLFKLLLFKVIELSVNFNVDTLIILTKLNHFFFYTYLSLLTNVHYQLYNNIILEIEYHICYNYK